MPTTTPSALRFPASTDTPNVPRDIQNLAVDTEASLRRYAQYPFFGRPYILFGAGLTQPGGLNIVVAAGGAVINAWAFNFDASPSLPLTASATNHIWLVQTLDGNGRHAGHTWEVRTTQAVPANAVYVGEVVTGASGITLATPSYRGVIAPGAEIARNTTASSMGAGDHIPIAVVGDGVTPVRFSFDSYGMFNNTAGASTRVGTFQGSSFLGAVGGHGGLTIGMSHAAGAFTPCSHRGFLPPFVGRRVFNLNVGAPNGGTPTIYADNNIHAIHRAEWGI